MLTRFIRAADNDAVHAARRSSGGVRACLCVSRRVFLTQLRQSVILPTEPSNCWMFPQRESGEENITSRLSSPFTPPSDLCCCSCCPVTLPATWGGGGLLDLRLLSCVAPCCLCLCCVFPFLLQLCSLSAGLKHRGSELLCAGL